MLEASMGFKENLLKKIHIDQITRTVAKSLEGNAENIVRLDKSAMRQLLGESTFQPEKIRDLELFVQTNTGDKPDILVLDNDLPIYHTDVEDVALRKSPTIKEMISIRNAIKILNDKDVVVSKKLVSLSRIQKECTAALDLSFDRNNMEDLERDGRASLENKYADGVKEALLLYAEILGLQTVPKGLRIPHHEIYGKIDALESGTYRISRIILYSMINDTIQFLPDEKEGTQREVLEFLKSLASGKQKTQLEGGDVFRHLTDQCMALSKNGTRLFYAKS
jgi:hypothetical protein